MRQRLFNIKKIGVPELGNSTKGTEVFKDIIEDNFSEVNKKRNLLMFQGKLLMYLEYIFESEG